MTHRSVRSLVLVLLVACAGHAGPSLAPSPARPAWTPSLSAPLNDAAQRWIDQTVAGLTLRQRVAQMVMVWVLGDYASTTDTAYAQVRSLVSEQGIGGVVMSLGSPIEVAAKVNDLQRLAHVPLLVASDVEPGLGRLEGGSFAPTLYTGGSATILPNAMAIGATGNAANAEEAGRITGAESRAIGIHLAFAPVVDVNNNPANPVINTRSFGEDPETVARFSAAFVRGVQGEGVAATAKHFPGHGDTDADSHLALPIVRSSRARLDSVELVPFRAAIKERVSSVMTAHIALPAVAHDTVPATLETSIVTGLLRDTLGFAGLTITDALGMQGIGKGYSVEQAVTLSTVAGADILLNPPDVPRAIDAVVAAVERGEIRRERIDASVRKVLEMKLRTGAVNRPIVPLDSLREIVGSAAHRESARRIGREAITLLRDERSLVPVHDDVPTLIVSYAGELDIMAGRDFTAELRQSLKSARVARVTPLTSRAQLDSLPRNSQRIIVHTLVRSVEGEGRPVLSVSFAKWLDSLAAERTVIVAASGNPYVIRELPHVSAYLATFGRGPALEQGAASALAGRSPITGHSPVSLPGFFARGDGLQRTFVGGSDSSAPELAPQRSLADTLRFLMDRAVADSAFPGAYVVAGRRSGVVAEYGAGHLDWASGSPRPDAHTLWDMASLTKVVALTSAMMQLVEQKKVELDAPVQRYLAAWKGPNKERVTVRDLLTHRSGLPSWRPLYKEATDPASALALAYATPLDTLPGVRMVYSDLGAILMGEIVRAVSGERVDAYFAKHVSGPLGMKESSFYPPDSNVMNRPSLLARFAPTEVDPWRQRHLRGEVHDENASMLGGVSAHAGLFSTGADVARFCRMYLSGGTLEGARIFDATTIRQFTTVQDSAFSNRALGWETPTGRNSAGTVMKRPAFGHTGFTGTSIWIDPAHDFFVVLLTNRVNPTRTNTKINRVRQEIADAVAGALGNGANR